MSNISNTQTRRNSREAAFALLYTRKAEQAGSSFPVEIIDATGAIPLFDADIEWDENARDTHIIYDMLGFDTDAVDRVYIGLILSNVEANASEIDELIDSHLRRWTIDRLSWVDLSIMRLALCEMKFMPQPLSASIVINEALELSHKYSTDQSSSLINGVLGNIARGN